MAAKSKSELREVAEKEFGKLMKIVGSIDAAVALKKRDEDTSIKDVIAHRAHWIDLFLGWHADGLAGKPVCFPAEGYKWNDLKRYNADLRERQSDLDWPGAVTMLRSNHDKLIAFIDGHTESDLYGGPMKGANNAWTPGRWAEAAGPSHFRSASKFLRATLKNSG